MSTLERSLAFFRPHHNELRKRLIRVFISIILFTIIAYIFSEQIALFFIKPLFDASPLVYRLVYTNLPEAFLAYIKLSLLIGVIASFPYTLYQTWSFVAPGLHDHEKKLAVTVVFWSSVLFISGAAFALFSVLPKLLSYFMSYAHESLEPLPKLGLYLTFVARMVLAFGLSFQIPFLMVMSGKAGIVEASYFRTKRLYFYGAIVVLAFLLSAGDFMATGLLSLPLFGLYEAGIFLTALFSRKKKTAEKPEEQSESDE
ncbi:MAG: twin-arginine translocase subunit TatC [Desulfobulbaceae bacterium]|nr:MAG: twin-arginine translocase subunit TatC [Desulfobulbaceae bacterium]